MSLEKQIARRNKGLRTVKASTAAILVGSVAATGAVTAGLASGSLVASENEQSQDTQADIVAAPQPPVNAPQAAAANAADLAVAKAKKKAAKVKAAKQAAAAQQQQQQQQSQAKSHGS